MHQPTWELGRTRPGRCSGSGLAMRGRPQPCSLWAVRDRGGCCPEQVCSPGRTWAPQQVSGVTPPAGQTRVCGRWCPLRCCHGGKGTLGAWKDTGPGQCGPEEGPHQGCGTVGWILLGNRTPVTLHVTPVVIPHTQEAARSSHGGPCPQPTQPLPPGRAECRPALKNTAPRGVQGVHGSRCAVGQGGCMSPAARPYSTDTVHAAHVCRCQRLLVPHSYSLQSRLCSAVIYFPLSPSVLCSPLFLRTLGLSYS